MISIIKWTHHLKLTNYSETLQAPWGNSIPTPLYGASNMKQLLYKCNVDILVKSACYKESPLTEYSVYKYTRRRHATLGQGIEGTILSGKQTLFQYIKLVTSSISGWPPISLLSLLLSSLSGLFTADCWTILFFAILQTVLLLAWEIHPRSHHLCHHKLE